MERPVQSLHQLTAGPKKLLKNQLLTLHFGNLNLDVIHAMLVLSFGGSQIIGLKEPQWLWAAPGSLHMDFSWCSHLPQAHWDRIPVPLQLPEMSSKTGSQKTLTKQWNSDFSEIRRKINVKDVKISCKYLKNPKKSKEREAKWNIILWINNSLWLF